MLWPLPLSLLLATAASPLPPSFSNAHASTTTTRASSSTDVFIGDDVPSEGNVRGGKESCGITVHPTTANEVLRDRLLFSPLSSTYDRHSDQDHSAHVDIRNVISYGRDSCFARVSTSDTTSTLVLDGKGEGETRKSVGTFLNNDDRNEIKESPLFYLRGGLIMTSGWGIDFSIEDPCLYPWLGEGKKVANLKEDSSGQDSSMQNASEEDGTIHDRHVYGDRDEGCSIEFEFRCASGGDEDVEAYEAGFDYFVGGPHTSGVPEKDIGAVEFFLNGMAMLEHTEAVASSTQVERRPGSKRVTGRVPLVPQKTVSDNESGVDGRSDSGWNTMRLVIGGPTGKSPRTDSSWILIKERSFVCSPLTRKSINRPSGLEVTKNKQKK